MQGAQLSELEVLYKEEQILRKRYFNTIEGWCLYMVLMEAINIVLFMDSDALLFHFPAPRNH